MGTHKFALKTFIPGIAFVSRVKATFRPLGASWAAERLCRLAPNMESLRIEASQVTVKIGERGVKLCFEIDFEELSRRVSALKQGGQVDVSVPVGELLPGEQGGAPAPWASRNRQASVSKSRQSERDCAIGWDTPLFARQPNWVDFWSRARPQLADEDIERNRLRVQMLLDLVASRTSSRASAIAQ